jgi:hypothetical protein
LGVYGQVFSQCQGGTDNQAYPARRGEWHWLVLAIENFKKSVELNPKNTYAADRIKKLGSETNK